ncbi:YidB family protein [Methylobacterium sp. WL120]|uniref:YidB family protein n=1 Tax=Methylobacterium sp. WL120 TaxID=2603887 RepID=UPI0011C7C51C|nr:YidB family protein [Methylobacterium sp. WL120]TXM64628.1 DUF937 domain-containing protein [Methylobacterium sp. WL120]
MSLFDTLKNTLDGSLGQAAIEALPSIIERVLPGGVQGLLSQLQNSGYATQVNSWLGRGANEPITAEDLRKVMDNEQVRRIADKLGIPTDQVLAVLAKVLPAAVDHHSPDGTLQTPSS